VNMRRDGTDDPGAWRTLPRVLCASRAALGVTYLLWSARSAVGRNQGKTAPATVVAGILGTRHVVQALLTADQPTSAVLVLGAEADAAHAATMAALGAVSGRWRLYALADALIAASLASAGLACAANAAPADPGAGPLLARRNRWAAWLARYLAPHPAPAKSGRGRHRRG
jgi:hypothetical protein